MKSKPRKHFLSNEYDNFTNTLQTRKQNVLELSNRLKAAEEKLQTIDDIIDEQDDVQQYIHCYCVEIIGVPTSQVDDPKQIAVERSIIAQKDKMRPLSKGEQTCKKM